MQVWRKRGKSDWTRVFYSKSYSISHFYCVNALERLLNCQIFKFIGDVSICTTINKSFLIFKGSICIGHHSYKLSWRISSLVGLIHAMITVKGLMIGLATNLAWNMCTIIERGTIIDLRRFGMRIRCSMSMFGSEVSWLKFGCVLHLIVGRNLMRSRLVGTKRSFLHQIQQHFVS